MRLHSSHNQKTKKKLKYKMVDSSSSTLQQVVSSDSNDDLLTWAEHQFSEFKKKYGKTYPTQEEDDYRFGVFMSNLRLARRNQIMDPTAVHGVTKFSDLMPSEFRCQYLGSGCQIQLPKDISKAPLLPTDDLSPIKENIQEKENDNEGKEIHCHDLNNSPAVKEPQTRS
ncbi:hypothetical protein Ddye_007165 [Dipteronia dyeriana]|uniref:Cathepsin propeptide inhibitor domain-containing protein n=1 Tax=Dipteronia dyeriana TaxID=168575 RepID=A0AAD9XK24_9ROSI|nr:hypothetical protein Ddye_007165 [Dipteronia dyeriana]